MKTLLLVLGSLFTFGFTSTPLLADSDVKVNDLQKRMDSFDEILKQRLDWSGELDSTANVYKNKGPDNILGQEAEVNAFLNSKVVIGPGTGRVNILLRGNAANPTRNLVRLNEGYLSMSLSPTWTLRGGKIIYDWGNSISYNPTDLINPIDYYDLTRPEKLGVLALDSTWLLNRSLSLQIGLLPVFQPSLISDPTSRWTDYSSGIRQYVFSYVTLPTNLPSSYEVNFNLSQNLPTKPQFFGKLDFRNIDFDLSFLYVFRYNPIPSDLLFTSSVVFDYVNNQPVVTLEGIPYYTQENVFGVDFTAPFLSTLFFLNSTLSIPVGQVAGITAQQEASNLNNLGINTITEQDIENNKRSSSVILNLGFKRDWARFHALIQYVRVQYLGSNRPGALFLKALGSNSGSTPFNPGSFYDFFSGSFIGGFSWGVSKLVTFRLGGLTNLLATGYLMQGGFDFHVKEGLRLSTIYEQIDGPEGSLFQLFNSNSNLSLNMNMVF